MSIVSLLPSPGNCGPDRESDASMKPVTKTTR